MTLLSILLSMAEDADKVTFTESVDDELTKLRNRRDSMRQERARLDRELATADDMIAALVRLRPDLRSTSDVRTNSDRARQVDVGPLLLSVLRAYPDADLPVAEIMARLTQVNPGSMRTASTTKVRNALRYLAKTHREVTADRDAENRLVYRFSTNLLGTGGPRQGHHGDARQ